MMWAEFCQYKQQIPSYGAILMNKAMDKVVLVRPYKGKSWGFPKGKVNEGEDPLECACREVYEETAFDIKKHLERLEAQGGEGKDQLYNEEEDKLEFYSKQGKVTHLFIVQNVPEDTDFHPIARKEISEIKWFPVMKLPRQSYKNQEKDYNSKFWLVHVFSGQLRRWIKAKKLQNSKRKAKKPKNKVKKQQFAEQQVLKKPEIQTDKQPQKLTMQNVKILKKKPTPVVAAKASSEAMSSFFDVARILNAMRPFFYKPLVHSTERSS